uniref:Uncharacterized protein n=1 Tax=Leersia perrieri TaxID=77586 RepID=A0A0D9XFB6_9ORYZ
MRVGPSGGVTEVPATEADGMRFNFVNGIDVYFTESSTNYTRQYEKVQLNSADSPAKHLIGVRLNGDGVEVEELAATNQNVTLSEVVERSEAGSCKSS